MNPGTILTVNANAEGVWSTREGYKLEYVCPGDNSRHVIVRRPGEQKEFGFPVRWLDMEDANDGR